MPTLQQMMQLKKQKASTGEPVEGSKADVPDSNSGEQSHEEHADGQPVHTNQPDELAQREAVSPPVKPAGGIKLGGLKLGQRSNQPIRSSDTANVVGAVSGDNDSTHTAGTGAKEESSGQSGLSLADIAGLGSDNNAGGEALIELSGIDSEDGDGYLDQVAANAPERELPIEVNEQSTGFIQSLDALYKLHDDPEMFASMVRKIMSEMQDNPALCDLLADEDSNTLIRGLRQHAGMAQVKKQESKAKYSKAKAKPQSAKVDSVMSTLQGLAGFDGESWD